MKWVTWDQAAISAVVSFVVAQVATRFPVSRARTFIQATSTELGLISFLYMLWRLAMRLPLDKPTGAIDRACQIDRFQHFLHIPSELSLQHFVLRHDWLARSTNFYYAVFHVPAMVAFLVWLFLRHRNAYPRWRSALAMLTAACLVIRSDAFHSCWVGSNCFTGNHFCEHQQMAVGVCIAPCIHCACSFCNRKSLVARWRGRNCTTSDCASDRHAHSIRIE